MVNRKRTPLQEPESDGEEFSDINSDNSMASKIIEDPVDDGWVFPIVQPKALRREYEAVCEPSSSIFN